MVGVVAVAARLEADASTAPSTSGSPRISAIWSFGVALGDVDRLAAEALGLREALVDQVADDHDRGAQQQRQ